MESEVAGDLSPLNNSALIYGANASFGQGFTATAFQLATAYAALANEGKLMKPYIIKEIRYKSGKIEKTQPEVVSNVISQRTQKLLNGMLVSVVENGHGTPVRLKDYYVAGKTGTAQIASPSGGYSEESNHTFAGYFPASDPRFVLVVRYEAPQRLWAESTAAPTFKAVSDFALNYYGVKGDRK
jgi:cell division protein FtsI/penicillin-binding protein 2